MTTKHCLVLFYVLSLLLGSFLGISQLFLDGFSFLSLLFFVGGLVLFSRYLSLRFNLWSWKHFLVGVFSWQFVRYFWILETLHKKGSLSFVLSSFLYVLAVFALSFLILFLFVTVQVFLRGASVFFSQKFCRQEGLANLRLCFNAEIQIPWEAQLFSLLLVFYLNALLNDFIPFGGMVGGSFLSSLFLEELYRDAFPLWGVYLSETSVLFFLFGAATFFLSKTRKKIIGFALVAGGSIFFIPILFYKAPSFEKTMEILIAPSPVPEKIKDKSLKLKAYISHKPNSKTPKRLIIWPESSILGRVEEGDFLERLQAEYLVTGESLLFGSDKQEFAKQGVAYFNTAFLLSKDNFSYQSYKKERLVPFAEYKPTWSQNIGVPLLMTRTYEYSRGKNRGIFYQGISLGVGICFEAYFDGWYANQEKNNPEIYIFLHREYLFSPWAQKILFNASRLKARQTGRSVVRVSDGGTSSVWTPQQKNEQIARQQNMSYHVPLLREGSFFMRHRFKIHSLAISFWIAVLLLLSQRKKSLFCCNWS